MRRYVLLYRHNREIRHKTINKIKKLTTGGNIKTKTKSHPSTTKIRLPKTHTFPIILLPQKRSDPKGCWTFLFCLCAKCANLPALFWLFVVQGYIFREIYNILLTNNIIWRIICTVIEYKTQKKYHIKINITEKQILQNKRKETNKKDERKMKNKRKQQERSLDPRKELEWWAFRSVRVCLIQWYLR